MEGLLAGIPMAVAILVLGGFLGWLYKSPLFEWLKNIKQVKSGETTIEMAQQAVEQQVSANTAITAATSASLAAPSPASSTPTSPSSAVVAATSNTSAAPNAARAQVLRNFGTSPVLIQREEEIRRDLTNVPTSDREAVLIRHLAVAQLERQAEETYRLIFGSQLGILHHLNIYGPEPEQRLVDTFVKAAAEQYPDAYATLNRPAYFDYLVNAKLVNRSSDSVYSINDLGKAFLEWLPAKGILANKAF